MISRVLIQYKNNSIKQLYLQSMTRHNRKTIINNSRNGSHVNIFPLMSYPSVTRSVHNGLQRAIITNQHKTSAKVGLLYRYMNPQPIWKTCITTNKADGQNITSIACLLKTKERATIW